MPLRDADEVGVPDVRRFSDLQVTDEASPAPAPDRPMSARRARPRSAPKQVLAAVPPDRHDEVDVVARPLLGDEPPVHLQADVPEEAMQRVKLVSFELGEDWPHLRRHQTILGALAWEFVDHTDQAKLDVLAELVDAYRAGPWHGLPEVRRLNARIPASLKRRMDGSLLALAASRREVSARVVLAALVWRHVVSRDEDAARFSRLVDVLGAYRQELDRRSLSAPLARAPLSG